MRATAFTAVEADRGDSDNRGAAGAARRGGRDAGRLVGAGGGLLHVAIGAAQEGPRYVELRGRRLARGSALLDERVELFALVLGELDREALLLKQRELVDVGTPQLEAERGEQLLGACWFGRQLVKLLQLAFRLGVWQVWRAAGSLATLQITQNQVSTRNTYLCIDMIPYSTMEMVSNHPWNIQCMGQQHPIYCKV